MIAESKVECGTREASCVCHLDLNHDGPHECPCGGSWERIDGAFRIVELPQWYVGPLGTSDA